MSDRGIPLRRAAYHFAAAEDRAKLDKLRGRRPSDPNQWSPPREPPIGPAAAEKWRRADASFRKRLSDYRWLLAKVDHEFWKRVRAGDLVLIGTPRDAGRSAREDEIAMPIARGLEPVAVWKAFDRATGTSRALVERCPSWRADGLAGDGAEYRDVFVRERGLAPTRSTSAAVNEAIAWLRAKAEQHPAGAPKPKKAEVRAEALKRFNGRLSAKRFNYAVWPTAPEGWRRPGFVRGTRRMPRKQNPHAS